MTGEALRWVKFGEIKPLGWMKTQMQNDLENGFVGHLDELAPDLITEDDIYGKDRLTEKVKTKDVGAITDGKEWAVQFLWWNSETQSNWWDGYICHAILTDDTIALKKVDKYIANKLKTQDRNGYIGIYADDLRYDHKTENGELWAQASLFRGMLNYYEATKDKKVLKAIVQAVDVTMEAYPVNKSTPFKIKKPYAGVGHGLTFTDVVERLYQLTGDTKYKDYAVFLYKDYDSHPLEEIDIQSNSLLDSKYKFKGHGVHTYEHLRALTLASYYSEDKTYNQALKAYFNKLAEVITPSGSPIGDEWVYQKTAHADSTGYEYCSIHELLDSYSLLLQKSQDSRWADNMEWLLFNGAQGARHPNESSIAYCKTDNSTSMMGALHKKDLDKKHHHRFKYSPVHQDVAVCCVPNAGRVYPYYIKAMWMKSKKGLVCNLFGASQLKTKVNGKEVVITQVTHYPFDLSINFQIQIEEENTFEVAIRKPQWANSVDINANAEIKETNEYIYINKTWKAGDNINISFHTEVIEHTDLQERKFISYGPLVFALPLEGKEMEIKQYANTAFHDLHYDFTQDEKQHYQITPNINYQLSTARFNKEKPWDKITLKAQMFDPEKKEIKEVTLYPMGGTILRKVSFDMMEE